MNIRPARDEDSEAVSELIRAIFAEYEGVLFVPEEMPELARIASSFSEQGGAFFCAEASADDDPRHGHAGAIVGCIGWPPSPVGVELKKLYVAAAARRTGLGARLAELVETAARARGAAAVELWSDFKFTTAHRFYERRGYVRGGTRRLFDASDTYEHHFVLRFEGG